MQFVKGIKLGKEAHESFVRGLDILANAVKITLGPGGRNVCIQNSQHSPHVTKDGVTVAKAINCADPFDNVAILLIKEAALRTNQIAGDGTTTATVLAQSLVKKGIELIESGHSPIMIRDHIESLKDLVCMNLEVMRLNINLKDNDGKFSTIDLDKLRSIAHIASNGDEKITKVVMEVVSNLGAEGEVTLEKSKIDDITCKIINGFKFDLGYIDQNFCNNLKNNSVDLENCYVLVTDLKINAVDKVAHFFDKAASDGKNLFIVCDELNGETASIIYSNLRRRDGKFWVGAVALPPKDQEQNRRDLIADIESYTGATCISGDKGHNFIALAGQESKYFGYASNITINKNSTSIINKENKDISTHLASLEEELKNTQNPEEEAYLKGRISRLTVGVGIIQVGGTTDAELRERVDRIEDSINATKGALIEGYVIGGGAALAMCGYNVPSSSLHTCLFSPAYEIYKNICNLPEEKQLKKEDFISKYKLDIDKLINEKDLELYLKGYMYDKFSVNLKLRNLNENGIIDPFLVVKTAFETACSIASLVLTTDCIIAEESVYDDRSKTYSAPVLL